MIESKFFLGSENKIIDSSFGSSHPKLWDGWKVNWTPDKGGLFDSFNKDTEYVINFNSLQPFDLIKIYFLPSNRYYWGTTQVQDDVSGLIVKLYYSYDGENFNKINNAEAYCINNWFNGQQAQWDSSYDGWNCGSEAYFLFLKLNQAKTLVKSIKFVLHWDRTDIPNWGITELEVQYTKSFIAKDVNIDNERKIIENSLNDLKVIINGYDLDYYLHTHNFDGAGKEVFGYIYKDNNYTYFSNLIIYESNINIENRLLTLILKPYSETFFNDNINYNTPILFKKSYYTASHVVQLILLQANIPQYYIDSYYGNLTPAVYYPNVNMDIKSELNDFLKSNLNITLKRNYANYFKINNYGIESYQTISQSNETYIEIPSGYTEDNNCLSPIIFNKNPFYYDNYFKYIFSQDLLLKDMSAKVYEKVIEKTFKRKTKKYLIFKMVDKKIEYETEYKEVEKARDIQLYSNLNLLDFPTGKIKNNDYYYPNDYFYISTDTIKLNCLTVPDPQNSGRMYCQADIYLSQGYDYTPKIPITQPKKISFKYKDIRGEQTIEYTIPNTVPYQTTKTYLKYDGDISDYYFFFRIRLALDYGGRGYIQVAFFNRNKNNNIETKIWSIIVDPTMAEGAFLRNFMVNSLSGYTQGICEMTINCDNNISSTFYQGVNFRISGIYLSGIARKWNLNYFPLNLCLDVNISEWKEREFYNEIPGDNNIEGEVYYRLGDNVYGLSEKEYTLPYLNYPATGNLYFIYILKHIYPYTAYGKLWNIKSIIHTNILNYSKSNPKIDKYSKYLSYAKTLENLDYEKLITRFSYYINKQKTEKKQTDIDFNLELNQSISNSYNLSEQYLIIGQTIFAFVINNKSYYFKAGNGTLLSDGLNISYQFSENLHNINYYFVNNNIARVEGKFYIFYKIYAFEGEKEIVDYTDLQKQYGIIEYEMNSGQLMTNSQVFFNRKFIEQFYNLSSIYTNNDIVLENDLSLMLNNYNIRIIDNYIQKYITIEPYYVNHYIEENLYSETSVRGKIISEDNI